MKIVKKDGNGIVKEPNQLVEYEAFIYHICQDFFPCPQDAEDITQEVILELIKSKGSFEGKAKMSTWIYKIARNKCLDEIKKRSCEKRAAFFVNRASLDDILTSDVSCRDRNPEERLEQTEMISVLRSLIDCLSPKQRLAFSLHHLEGYTYKEIGKRLEMTESAVVSTIHRGKVKLKILLEEFIQWNEL